jgi:hypothetical protein
MVQARNTVGYSANSTAKAILAAQISATPTAPVTSISGSYVKITWT